MEEFEDKSVEDVVDWLEKKGFDEGIQTAFRGNLWRDTVRDCDNSFEVGCMLKGVGVIGIIWPIQYLS